MCKRVIERRKSQRVSEIHPAAVLDADGYVLAKGRTSNISERGVFLIVDGLWGPELNSRVILELKLPTTGTARRPDKKRTVVYKARVVRTHGSGCIFGVGLELMEKVAQGMARPASPAGRNTLRFTTSV